MRVLLDTHTFIWWASGSSSLSATARSVLETRTNEVFLSAATTWEMTSLIRKGTITLTDPLSSFVRSQIELFQFQRLPITLDHTYLLQALPMHHKDPFDRILIAQAFAEALILVSRDHVFPQYGVQTLW